MKYLSVCSGIEAATVAWHPLGWQAIGFSEIEKFPSQVLAHHYPNVPNLGDMTKYKEWNLESNVDVFVGGTPCQSFSVAGLRKGLDDPRGNLMLTYLAIADKYRPRWLVWENVPGVLSSNGGKDFGTFLGGLGELGYGFAYRVLDAQYFGVAQRRRRVFVVGYLGDWRRAAAVLFERHSLSGNPAPRRQKGKSVTPSIGTGIESSLDCGVELTGPLSARDYKDAGTDGMNKNSAKMIPVTKAWPAEITSSLCASDGPKGVSDQYAHEGKLIAMAHGQGGAEISFNRSPTLTCIHEAPIVSYGIPGNWIGRKPENGGNATEPMHDVAPCLTKTDQHGVAQPIAFSRNDDGRDATYNLSPTMRVAGNAGGMLAIAQPIAYAFDSLASNSMKSSNPISGCNEVDVSKALDTSRGLDPSCNQGGIGVAQPISFDMAQITSKVNGTRVEPGLPVSTMAKGSQMHVALSVYENHPADSRVQEMGEVCSTVTSRWGTGGGNTPMVSAVGTDLYNGAITGDVAATMSTHGSDSGGVGPTVMTNIAPSLTTNDPSRSPQASEVTQQINAVYQASMAVRRLTPKECERLQGFPDNYSDIMPKGKPTPDGPRYKALGNSMAVPVMAWIGKRIQEVDNL